MKIPHWQEMVHARIQFMDLALPTPDGNQWLAAPPIDVLHATNIAGPIVEMEISTMPGDIFSFVETGDGFLAFVQMVFGRDAATPIDFIAWTRDKPWRLSVFWVRLRAWCRPALQPIELLWRRGHRGSPVASRLAIRQLLRLGHPGPQRIRQAPQGREQRDRALSGSRRLGGSRARSRKNAQPTSSQC
ncbi:MAG: hypothetical protein JWP84_3398 [Tardiphaga sp.]|nr:hypothetical protein [Tardiphaga sp.]